MNTRLFVKALESSLFFFWGAVTGGIMFQNTIANDISHNLIHFLAFWSIVFTFWTGIRSANILRSVYKVPVMEKRLHGDLILYFLLFGFFVGVSVGLLILAFF